MNKSWEIIEGFDAVNEVLFDTLVLDRLPISNYEVVRNWQENRLFLIEPSGGGFSAMISRDIDKTGYWDHEIDMLMQGDAVIAFLEYFDWDQFALIDFTYFHGLILESEKYPEIVGHHILIEANSAEVYISPKYIN